ncbi:MAG: glycogen/starch/alpha-glucan phosphorylase [Nitrospirota bacterium]
MPRFIKMFHESLLDHLVFSFAKDKYSATTRDKFNAVVLSVRENLVEQWMKTQQQYYYLDTKRIYYLSLEFLLGRLLKNYIINLGLLEEYSKAVEVLEMTYEDILDHEWEAGLGHGGLGRLAACFLDSMATLQYPAYGYGIRYEYGIFLQKIKNGYQIEFPDNWLRYGNPWEFPRPELIYPIHFYGRVNTITSDSRRFRMEWVDTDEIIAMAYDYPVPGFQNNVVNTLRLWVAKSSREFNLEYFNSGDYIKAIEDKAHSESISKVLYPNDQTLAGKELRFKQQYFFVSATIKDIIRRYKKFHQSYKEFPEKVAIQLNDTHPAIAIAELMRILVDEEGIEWDDAWNITKKTFAYTNHTVLPEALETWPEGLVGHILPRHLQIIQEIDRRFLIQVAEKFPNNPEKKWQMAIITGDGEKKLHMARLAIAGSHSINGVSRLHTDILKNNIFNNFFSMFPEKFQNVTNGVAPRRWLLESNPGLSNLITEAIGKDWTKNLEELRKLEPLINDAEFCKRFREIKISNKTALSEFLKKTYDLSFPISFLLDCQIKRFHEYKRQILNILHIITLYNKIKDGKTDETFVPRTFLFSGKTAPGYFLCKLIIKLIHCVSDKINAHPLVSQRLKVIFVPNYGVALAQQIIPAAELSEQISTAGEVGKDNFFLFGLTADEIEKLRPTYNPHKYYEKDERLHQIINQISDGYFSPDQPDLFHPIVKSLLENDRYFVLADYASYVQCQEKLSRAYNNKDRWTKMAILNIARCGKFSSDRAIREYAENIWKISPVPVHD